MSVNILAELDKEEGVEEVDMKSKKTPAAKKKGASIFDDVIEPAEERTVTVSMRIPEDIYNKIRAEARERDVSKSYLMSKFFVNAFKAKEKAVNR